MIKRLLSFIKGNGDPLERVIPVAQDKGKRLLPRTKWIIAFVFSLFIILLVYGIFTAGQSRQLSLDDMGAINPSLIGQATPPSPPPVLTDKLPFSTDSIELPHHDTLSKREALQEKQQGNVEHQTWLNNHFYQQQENQITRFERALSAPLTNGNQPLEPINNQSTHLIPTKVPSIQSNIKATEEEQFIAQNQGHNDGVVSPNRVIPALGDHEIMAGSVLNAILITAINSDLPGIITAQISQNLFDSLHPDDLLIPQGTKLIGRYDNHLAFGQNRVFIVWNSLLFPNGSTFNLNGVMGVDETGKAGLADLTDNHTGRIMGSAVLISLLGVGAQLSQPQNSSILTAPSTGQLAAGSAANEMNMVGSQLLQKNLNISPTIVIRAGTEFNVLVNQTLILPLYNHE